MPRYSAPGAIRRCHTAPPVHRTGANLSPANMCCPPAPAGTAGRRLARAGLSLPKLARRRSPTSPGADRPPACSMLPPTELAFSGIDLDSVPVPRIEETSGPGTFTRPMPEQAAILGQRGRQVLRPLLRRRRRCPARRAACRRRHLPAGTSPAQITQICPLRTSHADRQGPAPYRHRFYVRAREGLPSLAAIRFCVRWRAVAA